MGKGKKRGSKSRIIPEKHKLFIVDIILF